MKLRATRQSRITNYSAWFWFLKNFQSTFFFYKLFVDFGRRKHIKLNLITDAHLSMQRSDLERGKYDKCEKIQIIGK